MSNYIDLDPIKHKNVQIDKNIKLSAAEDQHLLRLRVTELGHAGTSFPLFATKFSDGNWMLVALTSFVPGSNSFVVNDEWQANYLPVCLQTYPLAMRENENQELAICIDNAFIQSFEQQTNHAVETDSLFNDEGSHTLYLKQMQAILEDDVKNAYHSYHFLQYLIEKDLLNLIDIQVQYTNGEVNSIKGLQSINEDKLQSLDAKTIVEMRDRGYLTPVYAMLLSLYQLNALIRINNKIDGAEKIEKIGLVQSKDLGA